LIKNFNVEYAIVRGYRSLGIIDDNATATIANAVAAGVPNVDVFLFPCVPCNNPQKEVSILLDALKLSKFQRIWLVVQSLSWSLDVEKNQNFITTLISSGKDAGANLGIFTNDYNWEQIVGINWNGAQDLPLWYAHLDNDTSFSDFTSFGGWTAPTLKMYQGPISACNTDSDLNWHP